MIYGSYLYDLPTLASAFSTLGYSYIMIGTQVGEYKVVKGKINRDIVLVESLDRAQRLTNHNVFIVDSKPALLNSNVDQSLFIKSKSFESLCNKLVKLVEVKKHITLVIKEPSLAEVVDRLTTKSVLTDVQTLVNRVTPYDLRKKIHAELISYVYGASTFSELQRLLTTHKRLNALYEVTKSDALKTIRKAVADYKKSKDEEQVAKQYGIHTFEILYIYNSYQKLGEQNDN